MLIVDRDTNLHCAAAPASRPEVGDDDERSHRRGEASAPSQPASEEMEQGQRKDETARGGGLGFGQCSFQPGDRVKAEVDDMGHVTTLEYWRACLLPRPIH